MVSCVIMKVQESRETFAEDVFIIRDSTRIALMCRVAEEGGGVMERMGTQCLVPSISASPASSLRLPPRKAIPWNWTRDSNLPDTVESSRASACAYEGRIWTRTDFAWRSQSGDYSQAKVRGSVKEEPLHSTRPLHQG
jgi:hypothetical protein